MAACTRFSASATSGFMPSSGTPTGRSYVTSITGSLPPPPLLLAAPSAAEAAGCRRGRECCGRRLAAEMCAVALAEQRACTCWREQQADEQCEVAGGQAAAAAAFGGGSGGKQQLGRGSIGQRAHQASHCCGGSPARLHGQEASHRPGASARLDGLQPGSIDRS